MDVGERRYFHVCKFKEIFHQIKLFLSSLSEASLVGIRVVATTRYDDVVKDVYAEYFGSFAYAACEIVVLAAGAVVARGMVVYQYDPFGETVDGAFQQQFDIHHGSGCASLRYAAGEGDPVGP